MRKIFMLVVLLTTIMFGQSYNPYTTDGWDAPYAFTGDADSGATPTWSGSLGYYGLGIMTINSNPGGWLNYNYWKIDSLLQALVVYTDTTQIIVRNDTLMLSESAAARLDTGFAGFTTIQFPVDTTQFNIDDDTLRLRNTYDDLRVPMTGLKAGGSKVPGWAQVVDNGAGSQGVFTYWFDDGTEEELYFAVQLPHDWMEGDTLHPHVHWLPLVDGGAGETVSWGFEYTWANIGSVFGNSTIIYTDDRTPADAAPTELVHYMSHFPAMIVPDKELSSMMFCRIFRDATGAGGTDDYTPDAGILEFDFHYKRDKMGSFGEYSNP